jgi:hypothetical protein
MKKAWMDIPFRLLIEASQMLRYHAKLLLAEVNLNRHSREVPLLTKLILKEATI